MRQKLSLLTKTMLLLGALVAGGGSAWAEETYTWTTASGQLSTTTTSVTINEVTWSFAPTWSDNSKKFVQWSGGSSNWYQIGSSNNKLTSLELSTSGISGTITNIDVVWSSAGSNSASLAASVGGSAFTSNNASTSSSTLATTNFTGSASGTITLSFTATTGIKLQKITVTYGDPIPATTVTIDATGITNTDVKEGTEAGTLTAIVAAGETTIEGATVTWSSNNTAVATVGETTGVVTLVTAGTAKITASYAGVAGTYKSSSADYTLTVTDSRTEPTLTFDPATLPTLATDDEDLTLTLTTDYDGTITATSSDASKATITATAASNQWTISPKAAGNVTFTFSGPATANYKAANATLSLTVTAGTSIKLVKTISISEWPSLSYGDASTYTVEGVNFTATQCMKNSGLQFKRNAGKLASPTIKSEHGYTLIATTHAENGSGKLTIQIGNEESVELASGGKTAIVTTTSTAASFTIENNSSNACNLLSLVIMPNLYVTSNGWATFITPAAMGFAAETAYIVTAVDEDEGSITIDDVTAVPANTPLLVKGEGVKAVSVPATAPSAPAGNLLSVSDGSAPASGYYNYVLAKDGDGAGFKQWTGDASTLKDRVVLVLHFAKSEARMLRFAEDDTQGISAALMNKETMNDVVYDLQGRSVARPTKGLYIVNGKKVIMK